jgi:hypothetical protein
MTDNLLEEIENDPDFAAPKSTNIHIHKDINQRLDMLELSIEATTLLLKTQKVFSEKLYQLAIGHIVDLWEYVAKEKPVVDEALILKSQKEFEEKARFLELIK